jgi:hypothetical protein
MSKKMIETNKKSNIVLGNGTVDFLPTEAQQAYTRPESATVNRNEGFQMREMLKKPNFTLAEQHAQGYSQ